MPWIVALQLYHTSMEIFMASGLLFISLSWRNKTIDSTGCFSDLLVMATATKSQLLFYQRHSDLIIYRKIDREIVARFVQTEISHLTKRTHSIPTLILHQSRYFFAIKLEADFCRLEGFKLSVQTVG